MAFIFYNKQQYLVEYGKKWIFSGKRRLVRDDPFVHDPPIKLSIS
jgi:hypothetical protein